MEMPTFLWIGIWVLVAVFVTSAITNSFLSPISWLIAIFPRSGIMYGVAFLVVIKLMLMATTAYICFKKYFPNISKWLLLLFCFDLDFLGLDSCAFHQHWLAGHYDFAATFIDINEKIGFNWQDILDCHHSFLHVDAFLLHHLHGFGWCCGDRNALCLPFGQG